VVLTAALVAALANAVPAQAVEAQAWIFLYADQQSTTQKYTPVNQASSAAGIQASVTRISTGNYRVAVAGTSVSGIPIVTAVGGDGVHCQLTQFLPSDIWVGCYTGANFTDSKFTLSYFSSAPPDSGAAGAYGYVYDNQPTLTSYTNPPSYNSTGGPVEIYYSAAEGIWTARFFGQSFNDLKGNVQVSAVGMMPARCAVYQWYPHVLGVDAQVRCDNLSGTTARPQWTLVYANDRSIVGNRNGFYGYLQADQPGSPVLYTPNPNRNLSPIGNVYHTVTRGTPGRYQAQIYGPLKAPVAVHVSVNGNTDAFCNLTRWTLTPNTQPAATVDLACFDSDGVPADNWFALNYYSPN
jgi:hypothetical protein